MIQLKSRLPIFLIIVVSIISAFVLIPMQKANSFRASLLGTWGDKSQGYYTVQFTFQSDGLYVFRVYDVQNEMLVISTERTESFSVEPGFFGPKLLFDGKESRNSWEILPDGERLRISFFGDYNDYERLSR